MRILVGREVSIQAIDAAHKNDDVVVLALQRDVVEEEVSSTGLYSVGVVARIQNVIPVPNGYFKVLLEACLLSTLQKSLKKLFEALVAPRKMINSNSAKDLKLAQSVIDEFSHYALDQEIQEDFLDTLRQLDQPIHIYYGILPFIRLSLTEKQAFLEATSLKEVAEKIQSVLYTLRIIASDEKGSSRCSAENAAIAKRVDY
jgi:ATP-dependent Lon protease